VSGAGPAGADLAVRVTVPEDLAELVGAILMEPLGAFEVEPHAAGTTLVFYPAVDDLAGSDPVELALEWLPEELRASGRVTVETREVSRDWTDGWKDHFRPIVIGEVRIRPPWEEAVDGAEPGGPLADVVINPGLGFGTGLHPTTRGTLRLLQEPDAAEGGPAFFRGAVVDAGTGSGILAIAAAKLGWGPVFAFDNDPVALVSARENVEANDVAGVVEIHQTDIDGASGFWFSGATVLANMTLDPVLVLLRKLTGLAGNWGDPASPRLPERVVVSGILAGEQEQRLLGAARLAGFTAGRKIYEGEWVSLELLPPKRPPSTGSFWS
jgi:ribosomal protein L11 methyltransferase